MPLARILGAVSSATRRAGRFARAGMAGKAVRTASPTMRGAHQAGGMLRTGVRRVKRLSSQVQASPRFQSATSTARSATSAARGYASRGMETARSGMSKVAASPRYQTAKASAGRAAGYVAKHKKKFAAGAAGAGAAAVGGAYMSRRRKRY